MPLGSESALGLAGPNGTPDIDELPAPAEPAGGVNCANAFAGTIEASATKRTSAGLLDIEGLSGRYSSTTMWCARSLGSRSSLSCCPSGYGVGVGERIRPNRGAITF
jgi:hypothetical protein